MNTSSLTKNYYSRKVKGIFGFGVKIITDNLIPRTKQMPNKSVGFQLLLLRQVNSLFVL